MSISASDVKKTKGYDWSRHDGCQGSIKRM